MPDDRLRFLGYGLEQWAILAGLKHVHKMENCIAKVGGVFVNS
jgi:hypothetical protein